MRTMTGLSSDQIVALAVLVGAGAGIIGITITAYRSDRIRQRALSLTDTDRFHWAVKLIAAIGILALAILYFSEYSMDYREQNLTYYVVLTLLTGIGVVLILYAAIEMLASIVEVQHHSTFYEKDNQDSLLESWRRSEHRYLVWRCLLRHHHDGAYWAFYATGVILLPASFLALFLNNLLGVVLMVYMLAGSLVSFGAAVMVAYRMGFELNCEDIDGIDEAVATARAD